MANGESLDKTLDRIENHVLRIEAKVDSINIHGCAQRPNDVKRLEELEKWRDRGVLGTIGAAISIAGSFAYTWITKK